MSEKKTFSVNIKVAMKKIEETRRMIEYMDICFKNYLDLKCSEKIKHTKKIQKGHTLSMKGCVCATMKKYPNLHPTLGWEKSVFDQIVALHFLIASQSGCICFVGFSKSATLLLDANMYIYYYCYIIAEKNKNIW